MKKHTLVLLVVLIIAIFPLDLSIFLNRAFGWTGHTLIWLALVAFVIYNMKGNTIGQKWNHFLEQIKMNGIK